MDLDAFGDLVTSYARVREVSSRGPRRWQLGGRLVARQLDTTHVVVRVPFDVRDLLLQHHPGGFTVPARFAKHMMVVADLDVVDDDALEDAVRSAWRLQSSDEP